MREIDAQKQKKYKRWFRSISLTHYQNRDAFKWKMTDSIQIPIDSSAFILIVNKKTEWPIISCFLSMSTPSQVWFDFSNHNGQSGSDQRQCSQSRFQQWELSSISKWLFSWLALCFTRHYTFLRHNQMRICQSRYHHWNGTRTVWYACICLHTIRRYPSRCIG